MSKDKLSSYSLDSFQCKAEVRTEDKHRSFLFENLVNDKMLWYFP